MPIFKSSIPVLMYHHVNNFKNDLVTITPGDFEKQIKFLSDSGYKSLFLSEINEYIEGKVEIPKKTVVITFDDGFLDNWVYAFPILKRYNVKATIFISTSWLTDKNLIRKTSENKDGDLPEILSHKDSKEAIRCSKFEMSVISWAEAKEMFESGLIDFQSHTCTHVKIEDDTDIGKISVELKESKMLIEKRLGKTCEFLAWPWGKFNLKAIDCAKKAGYKALYTVERGSVNKGDDPFSLKRIVVKRGDINWFKKRMLIYSNSFFTRLYLKVRF